MLNFKSIVTMTGCFGNERIVDLYATVSNVLLNTTNNDVVVLFNTEDVSPTSAYYLNVLEKLAAHTGNKFTVAKFPPETSLAQMYIGFMLQERRMTGRTYWLSIDDDVLVPRDTLYLLEQAASTGAPGFLYGFYEVVNKRNYADWSPTVQSCLDALKIANEQSVKSLVHQNYVIPDVFIPLRMAGQYSGSFMVRIDRVLENQALVDEWKKWPKGRRGVDVHLCQSLSPDVYWIMGSTAFHTDKTGSDLDNGIWWDMHIAEKGESYPIKYTNTGEKQ